ncbi:suppressor of tumorigenicity 7 protein homolog isoform X2 [Xenopus laevis]|uniref:Suppressor of tumorigenicity 7 protein homolog isoform X2 n=1 Tax=Xenopus laevis TaxID=8355 RepID=A0A8J0U6P0_XENLA|nr:suppressor of tumorigenicity 7 protein homolog isoform X2 [Xenopus laevis]
MADSDNSGFSSTTLLSRLRGWVSRCWAYAWVFFMVISLVTLYHFRVPLRLYENLASVVVFINTLTPKFYVALTGTSSVISGLILVFEWCYFKKYGTSFIEQVSVNHLRPLMGGNEPTSSSVGFFPSIGENEPSRQPLSDCKVWRNPLNLFRGAEYNRYTWVTGREPLTYYDMNLSAQDHQTFFTCDTDSLRPSDAVMQKAWRERSPQARIKAAYQALNVYNDCATAYILLAEEEATTISDAENFFQQALKAGESAYRKSQQQQHLSTQHEAQHRRDTNVLIYAKRRLAICARRLGRVKEAVKIMRDLMKEFPLLSMVKIHENLLEALLELQAYADVQAVLAKYDGWSEVNKKNEFCVCVYSKVSTCMIKIYKNTALNSAGPLKIICFKLIFLFDQKLGSSIFCLFSCVFCKLLSAKVYYIGTNFYPCFTRSLHATFFKIMDCKSCNSVPLFK